MTAPLDLQGLRALAEKATPGPWEQGLDCLGSGVVVVYADFDGDRGVVASLLDGDEASERDAAFIAAANPAVVLRLLERLEAAEKVCEAAGTHERDHTLDTLVKLRAALSAWRTGKGE